MQLKWSTIFIASLAAFAIMYAINRSAIAHAQEAFDDGTDVETATLSIQPAIAPVRRIMKNTCSRALARKGRCNGGPKKPRRGRSKKVLIENCHGEICSRMIITGDSSEKASGGKLILLDDHDGNAEDNADDGDDDGDRDGEDGGEDGGDNSDEDSQ